MKHLKLEYRSFYTGEWYLHSLWALNDFLAQKRQDMWEDEVEKVRSLGIGQSFTGGHGVVPEWRVTRLYKKPVFAYDHRNDLVVLCSWAGIAAELLALSVEELKLEFLRTNVLEAEDMSYRDETGVVVTPHIPKSDVRRWRRHAQIVLQRRANKTA